VNEQNSSVADLLQEARDLVSLAEQWYKLSLRIQGDFGIRKMEEISEELERMLCLQGVCDNELARRVNTLRRDIEKVKSFGLHRR
jgi:hypothetical protein